MKNVIYLFCFMLLVSCNSDNNQIPSESENVSAKKLESFINAEIGSMQNKKLNLSVSDEQILSAFKRYPFNNNRGLKPLSGRVEKINNKHYFRIYSEDEKISTVELIVSKETGKVFIGKTICTSTACSSNDACVPNGLYCENATSAKAQIKESLKCDCSRTTSS